MDEEKEQLKKKVESYKTILNMMKKVGDVQVPQMLIENPEMIQDNPEKLDIEWAKKKSEEDKESRTE